uniref:Bifunctional inhibitor/plant lipid transfer protein/seed storage helical domain-containing protein n=1 Tax=Oryza meridionalis TaxID=40149 RepID=A0A0E0EBB5_9ORYZ
MQYATAGSPLRQPPGSCCTEVERGVKDPAAVGCVCTLLAGNTYGLPLNLTRAAGLPAACGAPPTALATAMINMIFGIRVKISSPVVYKGGIACSKFKSLIWSSSFYAVPSPKGGDRSGSSPKSAATPAPITIVILVATVAGAFG